MLCTAFSSDIIGVPKLDAYYRRIDKVYTCILKK